MEFIKENDLTILNNGSITRIDPNLNRCGSVMDISIAPPDLVGSHWKSQRTPAANTL